MFSPLLPPSRSPSSPPTLSFSPLFFSPIPSLLPFQLHHPLE